MLYELDIHYSFRKCLVWGYSSKFSSRFLFTLNILWMSIQNIKSFLNMFLRILTIFNWQLPPVFSIIFFLPPFLISMNIASHSVCLDFICFGFHFGNNWFDYFLDNIYINIYNYVLHKSISSCNTVNGAIR